MLGSMVFLGIFLVMLTMAPAVFGQATATVTGTVMDQSKAVVPNATVVLIDEATNDTRKSVSNNDGFFVFTALQAKTYKVRVELKGFQTWERIGIVVHPGDKINIDDIVIVPGSENQTITVSAEAGEIVPVDSAEKSEVITATQIQNLSIIGRDATELLKILPGMVMVNGDISNRSGYTGEYMGINGNGAGGKQSAIGNYSANGGRNDAIDITADGAHVSDPGCNCASPVSPNVDMIQEFKVQTSNFTAENSKGPVVVSSVAKSGTSEYHGTVYYTGRRHELNSEEYFAKAQGFSKPNSDFSFPGFNIGGPVKIPGWSFNKNKDKLFFFFGSEWIRQNIDVGVHRAVVPTDANRNNDFSNSDGQMSLLTANPGAQAIPNAHGWTSGHPTGANAIDPGGLIIYKMYPSANWDPSQHNGYNWGSNDPIKQNMNMQVLRVDYSISDNTKLYARYQREKELQPFVYGLWWDQSSVPLPGGSVGDNTSQSVSVNLAKVFNPTLTNEFVFAYTYVDFANVLQDPSKMSKSALGFPYQGIFHNNVDLIPGVVSWSGPSNIWMNGGYNPILYATKHLTSFSDNVTKVKGTHTFKFGGSFENIINKQPNSGYDQGYFQSSFWDGNSTGNEFTDWIGGNTNGTFQQISKNVVNDEAYNMFEGFAQDSWKAKPNLTLEMGLRVSHIQPWYGRHGIAASIWNESTYSNNPADLTKWTGLQDNNTTSSIPLAGYATRALFYQPRLGMAYSILKNTVLRGGWGMYYYHDAQQAGQFDNPPMTLGTSLGPAQGVYTLKDVDTALSKAIYGRQGVNTVDSADNNMPHTMNWNVTISQRLPKAMLLEVSYVGNKSGGLGNNGREDINYVPAGSVIQPWGATFDWNTYRPRVNYSNIYTQNHTQFANYNSFQALLARQTGRFTYSVAYTWGKAMGFRNGGNSSGNLTYNVPGVDNQRMAEWGPLAFDRTHNLAIAYSYQIPKLIKGDSASAKIGGGVVNGWQFSGISTFTSGANIAPYSSNGNFNLTSTYLRVNASNGLLQQVGIGQAQVTGSNAIPLMPLVTCNPAANLKPGQYINGDCFASPYQTADGQLGVNGDFVDPYVHGPYFQNHDLAIYKNFQVGKNESRKIQLRFSAFNFLNHPLDSFRSDSQSLILNFVDGVRHDQGSVPFGVPESKFGKRVISFAAKFYF